MLNIIAVSEAARAGARFRDVRCLLIERFPPEVTAAAGRGLCSGLVAPDEVLDVFSIRLADDRGHVRADRCAGPHRHLRPRRAVLIWQESDRRRPRC